MAEISIVVPCYNCERYIEETVKSVCKQSFTDWELILVDDHSKDNTIDILHSMAQAKPDKIRVISLDQNSGGPAKPRNFGIEAATGDYIAFLDSDDIWHPKKLEVQLSYMKSQKLTFSCTQRLCFDLDPLIKDCYFKDIKAESINYSRLLKKNIISNSSVVIARELVEDKRFREETEFVAVEDYAFWLKVLEKGEKCFKIALPLLYYRLEGNSISNNKMRMLSKIRHVLRTQLGETSNIGLISEYYWFTNIVFSVLDIFKKKSSKAI